MRFPIRPTAVAAIALVVAGTACGGGDDAGAGASPLIVTSTSIWADVVANTACDGLVRVESLMPAGADPHAYEPSLADRQRLEQADLVVVNGLGLEAGLDDTIDEVERSGVAVHRITDDIATIALSGEATADEPDSPDAHEDEETEGHAEGDDPHVWFDPQRVESAVAPLADALVEAAGLDAAAVGECADEYRAELAALDTEIEALVESVPDEARLLVTNHDVLGYFADRYGLEILGTVIPGSGTLAEANPGALAELADAVEAAGVAAVFADEQHADDEISALADEAGVPVVAIQTGSLGESGTATDSYTALLRTAADRIVGGLTGESG